MATVLRCHQITTETSRHDSHLAYKDALLPPSILSHGSVTISRHEDSQSASTRPTSLLYINEDVLNIIIAELPRGCNDSLAHLSLCCRQLRYLAIPVLFSRCAIRNWEGPDTGIPPLAIRPFVRHLTYNWSLYHPQYLENYRPKVVLDFTTALSHLPRVQSVTFDNTANGVQWEAMKHCLRFAQVKSISFRGRATFTYVPPYPEDAHLTCSALEELHYPTPLAPILTFGMKRVTTLHDKIALERGCLTALLLGMHSTARSLVLPMSTAPLRAMATTDWPVLQDLFLGGSFFYSTDAYYLTCKLSLLLCMPNLRHLVICAALPNATEFRCRLLDYDPPLNSGPRNLRSLIIAYPDPCDSFFSIPFPDLSHLSLRDWPRHYTIISKNEYRELWQSPILSATEALSILRRVRAPGLTTLELVYSADEADDELLRYIAQCFPRLQHLELHRYRRSPDETVDHQHIACTLATIPALVTLRLNLDFKDDPGAGDFMIPVYKYDPWRSQLAAIGWDMLDSMDTCPTLEVVALLYHATTLSSWLWLWRSRRASRTPVCDSSIENSDTLPSSLPSRIASNLMYYD